MEKYFKVIKENFLWEVGTIIKYKHINGSYGYELVDDVFKNEFVPEEYISAEIIENNPEYFQRVFAVNLLTKTVYKTKEQAREYLKKGYDEK